MKLTGIEAVRYGALQDGCLAGLGDGLTVVLGPNESGKSTFTALTRHVLYGFPQARTRERGYVPPVGERVARLVFSEGPNTWAIERVDGVRRGPVSVTARTGAERPDLLDEIVSGVSEQSYRVVFGFGLDEMAEIESAESADVVARLYAGAAGLSVNPVDVRRSLEGSAAELFAARASKPRVNMLAARTRALRDEVRALEAEASSYAGEQLRLRELEARLEPVRRERDDLDLLARELDRDVQRVQDVAAQRSSARDSAASIEKSITEAQQGLDMIDVDERLLAAGPALTAVLDDTSGFKARLEALTAAEALAAEAERAIAAMPGIPDTITDSAEDRAAVGRWRDRITDATRDHDAARRACDVAQARADQSAVVEKEQQGVAHVSKRPIGLAVTIVVVGVAASVASVLAKQWIAVGLGALIVVAGIVVLLRRSGVSAQVAPLTAESARLKADALAQAQLATEAAQRLEAVEAEWQAWLAERGLDAWSADPAAVRELLTTAQERSRSAATRDAHLATGRRERAEAEEWVVRLVDVIRTFDDEAGQIPALTGALELAARVRTTLERAQVARNERNELTHRIQTLSTDKAGVLTKVQEADQVLAETAHIRGVDAADPLPGLESAAAQAETRLAEAKERFEEHSAQVSHLRGQLDDEGRDDRMTRARQQLEGLRAEAEQAAESYIEVALSARLLDRTRESYERDRQPEVIRTAAHVFSAMTAGRYTDVRVPLDNTGVSVVTAQGVMRTSEELSRGTAEQLYLALRVGLIGSLGELGRMLPVLMDDVVVNFDPERRAGAAAAVRELAQFRQVIYFTCHPETAELLQREIDGTTLVTLDRCAMR